MTDFVYQSGKATLTEKGSVIASLCLNEEDGECAGIPLSLVRVSDCRGTPETVGNLILRLLGVLDPDENDALVADENLCQGFFVPSADGRTFLCPINLVKWLFLLFEEKSETEFLADGEVFLKISAPFGSLRLQIVVRDGQYLVTETDRQEDATLSYPEALDTFFGSGRLPQGFPENGWFPLTIP